MSRTDQVTHRLTERLQRARAELATASPERAAVLRRNISTLQAYRPGPGCSLVRLLARGPAFMP